MRFPAFGSLLLVAALGGGYLLWTEVYAETKERTDFSAIDVLIDRGQAQNEAELNEMLDARAAERAARSAPTAMPTTGPIVFGDRFPEVIAVEVILQQNDEWRFNVTLSSPYDTPQRYADAWRVLDAAGRELGIRVLLHDHANEQPFTRSETIRVPRRTDIVYVEGRDLANGWSGQRFEVVMP